MINIEKFIRIRKQKKFSQSELAKGICTQVTLSRFENNGQVPAFKILVQLCNRLEIEPGDIMFSSQNNPITLSLNEAEMALINDNYTHCWDILTAVNKNNFQSKNNYHHFLYINGMYDLKVERDPMRAAYQFNTILLDSPKRDNIYYSLALLGLSRVYEQENDLERAEANYQQLTNNLDKLYPQNELDLIHLLSMLYHSGNFFGKTKSFKKSNVLLRKALQLARKKHVSYYAAKILCRLAANDIRSHDIKKRTRQYLYDACTFAKFNQNPVTLNRARRMLNYLDQE